MKLTLMLIGSMALPGLAAAQDVVTFTTETYPPYTQRNADGSYGGAGIEQVEAMMRNAGLHFTVEIMPWARALATAETQPTTCVFAAARTPEREHKFKWVAPLHLDRSFLVRHAQTPIRADNLEEARRFTVSTHRADYTEALLRRLGFASIDISADFAGTLNKLLERRVDIMPMSESVYDKLRAEGAPVEKVVLLSEQQLGIACNDRMPDETVARMQAGLDTLIREKQQDAILMSHGVKPLRLWAR